MDNLREERYRAACWWLSQGVDVVPLKPLSKELQPGYGPRKAQIHDTDFAKKWFLNTNANLGIVLGERGGIIVLDWDDTLAHDEWQTKLATKEMTLIEKTARGYHYFYRVIDYPPKLSNVGCEVKSSGVCMVSPSVHPNGFVYKVINTSQISTLDCIKLLTLFPFLSNTNNGKPSNSNDIEIKERRRKNLAT